jgi:hypothetical protein
MSAKLAPIILFIYNRPLHTHNTLEALAKNEYAKQSDLFVFADGAKPRATPGELQKINETRAVIGEKQWCKNVQLIAREKNMNLEDNVIEGITEIISKYGKAIILEDDLITSPYFLKYCNEALEVYADDKRVFSINGFMHNIDFNTKPDTFLCPLATSSWGWATWADRWNKLEINPQQINNIADSSFLTNRFNFAGADYTHMLKNMNTWDIRWYYTSFINNALGLFPTHSLIKNTGFDNSGTHIGNENLNQELYLSPIPIVQQASINMMYYANLLNYFAHVQRPSFINRIGLRLKRILLNR